MSIPPRNTMNLLDIFKAMKLARGAENRSQQDSPSTDTVETFAGQVSCCPNQKTVQRWHLASHTKNQSSTLSNYDNPRCSFCGCLESFHEFDVQDSKRLDGTTNNEDVNKTATCTTWKKLPIPPLWQENTNLVQGKMQQKHKWHLFWCKTLCCTRQFINEQRFCSSLKLEHVELTKHHHPRPASILGCLVPLDGHSRGLLLYPRVVRIRSFTCLFDSTAVRHHRSQSVSSCATTPERALSVQPLWSHPETAWSGSFADNRVTRTLKSTCVERLHLQITACQQLIVKCLLW